MRTVLLAVLITCVSTGASDGFARRIKRFTNDDDFDEQLQKGYNMLKNERNAENTMRLLEQLHNMEKGLVPESALAAETNTDSLSDMEDYVEIENDHIQPMGDSIEEINRNSGVEAALFQGDMLLTKDQADEIMETVNGNEGDRIKRQAYRDETYPESIWSEGVYYSFYENSTRDRIHLIKEDGCWSNIGKIGGEQHLSLGRGCETVGRAIHEIGHSLGLFHTHSRHDRDDFIELNTQNFADGWLSEFTKQSRRTNYNYNLTYDYGSVMHYGATSVSKNGMPIMVPRDVKYMQTLGSSTISFYDSLMINLHYKCLDKCTPRTSAVCQNGGFPHPRDCSKCICPTGYGGRRCKKRPSGCGEVLKATTSFQSLEANVGGRRSDRESDDLMTCNYWIQAPSGSKIEVVLDSYPKGITTDGCKYSGVEIKTGSDKRRTGYRFCSTRSIGTSLISTHNIVPIIAYSGSREIKTTLRYRIREV